VASKAGEPEVVAEGQVQQHDFGIVRTGAVVRHSFLIRNISKKPWTFARFGRSCSCTVSRTSTERIPPSASGEVEVTYRTGTASANDQRTVDVHVAEEDAPVIMLVVKAQVRNPITVSNDSVDFQHIGLGETPEYSLDVENYSDREFRILSAKSSSAWLRTSQVQRKVNGSGLPRQAWRIAIRAETGSLQPGRYRERILIEAEGVDVPPVEVAVNLSVNSPIEVSPARMFYGTVLPGRTAERKVLLMFNEGSFIDDPAEIVLSHDLGERFQVEIAPYPSKCWIIKGRLTPKVNDRFVEGVLSIGFRKQSHNVFEIPINAVVRQQ
jgi:hypothetical protein